MRPHPRVVMTLLVRDEIDIVEAVVTHHLHLGVDLVVATDNGSVDGTRAVLAGFEREGVLRVVDEPGQTYDQWRWVTRMARLAADHGADWVLHCDADEFWVPKGDTIPSVLANVPADVDVVAAPRVNFLPPEDDADGDPIHRMTVREVASLNDLGDPLPPKVCHRARRDVVVEQGNHSVRDATMKVLEGPPPFTILHLPLRGWHRYAQKIVAGGEAYERNTELAPSVGATWRAQLAAWRSGELEGWYRARRPSPEDVVAAVAAGDLVVDRRLLATTAPGAHREPRVAIGGAPWKPAPAERPERPAALRTVGRAVRRLRTVADIASFTSTPRHMR